MLQQAQVLLANIIKLESDYKNEAILLRRQLTPGEGKAPTNIDEALALAESSAAAENWNEAKQGFEQAITLGTNPKDAKKLAEAKQRLNQVNIANCMEIVPRWKSHRGDGDSQRANEI